MVNMRRVLRIPHNALGKACVEMFQSKWKAGSESATTRASAYPEIHRSRIIRNIHSAYRRAPSFCGRGTTVQNSSCRSSW